MSGFDLSKEVDFSVLKEDWTRYLLKDESILKVRIGVLKLANTGLSEIGVPNFSVAVKNLLAVLAPKKLWKPDGEKQKGDITPDQIKNGIDVDFEPQLPQAWQEYKTTDGWLVFIKPSVGKVVRIGTYTPDGEPVYWASIEHTFNVKKA